MKKINIFLATLILFFPLSVLAFSFEKENEPLSVEKAFQTEVLKENDALVFKFYIEHQYYIYKDRVKVLINGEEVEANLPTGFIKNDAIFGEVETFPFAFSFSIPYEEENEKQEVILKHQGCAEEFKLCYTPVTEKFIL